MNPQILTPRDFYRLVVESRDDRAESPRVPSLPRRWHQRRAESRRVGFIDRKRKYLRIALVVAELPGRSLHTADSGHANSVESGVTGKSADSRC